ncbi:MAG: bifunctional 2-C-methyl-D-erythritol 4-phosphate cytidylyltransferase/2-C-methyl-D-erythritol 2,4-cyclodiphosphate synthase [Hyphomonadaceae bacterium]|nr:bifunctional 2-C-methyl-D-erythritol 4-phosphate cytidylyltransferase/2-C-methyl-D-erythritol 2,4-cyclodiphosphate synthase [Hyphomonadaceae bacterium]
MHNQQAFLAGNTGAVIVAAGSGTRMGVALPKQFQRLGGKPVLRWSVEAMLQCEEIAAVVVVIPAADRAQAVSLLPANPRLILADGGATRTESVRNGLKALEGRGLAKVLIHDAARPGLTPAVVRELIAALDTADAAAPALPVTDALKDIGDKMMRTISRDRLVRVQTPQAFRFDLISKAIAGARDAAVDDLALVEASGARVVLTPGRAELMKITHPEDMGLAEKLIAGATMRVGTGFDVHGFIAGDGVIICGVRIPHTKRLEGHSDADVGWHALTDAILGAAALGDIGDHFPPSDPKWKDADSLVFLQHAAKLAAERGFHVVNADITLMCEKPKISPHREAMRAKTAEALAIPLDAVSVKATTTEKLGFLGREEGIAAQAVVLLSR